MNIRCLWKTLPPPHRPFSSRSVSPPRPHPAPHPPLKPAPPSKLTPLSLVIYRRLLHSPTGCYTPQMKFKILQESLRKILWERIESGELTGLRLAQQTGFKQAHISNFLNRKRGLGLEGMDKVLSVQHLSVLDLLDSAEVNKRPPSCPPAPTNSRTSFSPTSPPPPPACHHRRPRPRNPQVPEVLPSQAEAPKSRGTVFLAPLRPDQAGPQGRPSMAPRLVPGSTLLIDRHYNSLRPYRKGELNLYVVLKNDNCTVRYVELAEIISSCVPIASPPWNSYPSPNTNLPPTTS